MPVDTVKALFFLQNYHGLKEEREIWHNPLRLPVLFEGGAGPLSRLYKSSVPVQNLLSSRQMV